MGKLEQITQQISALEGEELDALMAWFEEFKADQWDRQMAADAEAGRLDKFAEEALAEHRAGRTTPI
jgi:hypothetical protein